MDRYSDYYLRHYWDLEEEQKHKVSSLFNRRKKRLPIAYFLWLVGFAFGLHRFYTGNYGTGLIIAAITIFTLGLGSIVGFFDVLSVEKLVFKKNDEIISEIAREVKY